MIPAEAVEAAAKALALDRKAERWFSEEEWDGIIPDRYKDSYRRQAQLALEAAAPYMLAAAWDEGRRADDFEVSIGLDRNPYMLNNEGEK